MQTTTSLLNPETPALVLREYGEGEAELTGVQERNLRRLIRGRLTVLPGDAPDHWRVKASSYVGTVVAPNLRIMIRPKVPIANLFHLLEASGRALELGQETFDYERTNDLVPSFATFFARHLGIALGRGVFRAYCEQDERLGGIRGRVNFAAQQRAAGLPLPVECVFDDQTADVSLNRVLRAGALRLLRLPGVTLTTRRALRQLARQLEEAGTLEPTDLRNHIVFTRLNEHFRSAERLARIVLADSSLLDAAGAAGAAVFLIDMNKVFEEFVESRLRVYLIDRLRVRSQWSDRLDVAGSVAIRPDLIFTSTAGNTVYVADSKYKVTEDGFARESDYHQLLAYTSALDLTEGLLIYCQHDGRVPPREIKVRNVLTRLRTRAIRLDRTIQHVEQELRVLAEEIATRASLLERELL